MKSIFEEMGGTYTLGEDEMYYPDLELSEEEPHYGKYGRMRRAFLKQNKPMLFNDMILTESLFPHLWEVQQACEKRMELLMTDLLEKNQHQARQHSSLHG